MGIRGDAPISDNAPHAIKEHKLENYFGRKIAIDASMSIYQFLIAVRQAGGEGQLTNEAGEVTSHLTGMFYRTIRLMENGIKPVFVFDGKPPTMKGGQLAKRKERQQAAEAELTKLTEEGGAAEDIERQQKRLVRASREQSEEVKTLLRLMGVPVLDAPCEAEATCAAICRPRVRDGHRGHGRAHVRHADPAPPPAEGRVGEAAHPRDQPAGEAHSCAIRRNSGAPRRDSAHFC